MHRQLRRTSLCPRLRLSSNIVRDRQRRESVRIAICDGPQTSAIHLRPKLDTKAVGLTVDDVPAARWTTHADRLPLFKLDGLMPG